MSHHLATPLAGKTGQLYIDDMYVFPGDNSTVFVMNVNSTVTGEHSEPSFRPEARYEFKVHLNGAETEDLTYRVTFGKADSEGRQPFQLFALAGPEARDNTVAGKFVLEGRTGETANRGDTKLWAGRIGDSFYIDLSLLDIVSGAVRNGTALDLSGWHPENAKNSFDGTTVDSIVLEVSYRHPTLKPSTPIAVWCATKVSEGPDDWHQINRFGHPMIWPIFWPDDVQFTHPANTRQPSEDFDADGKHIAGLIASTIAATGTSGDPDGYGDADRPRAVPGRPVLRGRHSGGVRLRGSKRSNAGRQRTRSHALTRHEHRYPVGTKAVRLTAAARCEFSVCGTSVKVMTSPSASPSGRIPVSPDGGTSRHLLRWHPDLRFVTRVIWGRRILPGLVAKDFR